MTIEQLAEEYLENECYAMDGDGPHRDSFLAGATAARSIYEAERAEMIGALEFYANKSNWKSVTVEDTNRRFCIMFLDGEYDRDTLHTYCGRRARAALSKVSEK